MVSSPQKIPPRVIYDDVLPDLHGGGGNDIFGNECDGGATNCCRCSRLLLSNWEGGRESAEQDTGAIEWTVGRSAGRRDGRKEEPGGTNYPMKNDEGFPGQ